MFLMHSPCYYLELQQSEFFESSEQLSINVMTWISAVLVTRTDICVYDY